METQFSRNEIIIGKEKQDILNSKTVAIFGIGGVGGYVAESLARTGIKNLILIDNDTISISNINRQIIALHSTIGKYKVDIMKERLKDINPNINIITFNIDKKTLPQKWTSQQKVDTKNTYLNPNWILYSIGVL